MNYARNCYIALSQLKKHLIKGLIYLSLISLRSSISERSSCFQKVHQSAINARYRAAINWVSVGLVLVLQHSIEDRSDNEPMKTWSWHKERALYSAEAQRGFFSGGVGPLSNVSPGTALQATVESAWSRQSSSSPVFPRELMTCAVVFQFCPTELKNDCACHQFARENHSNTFSNI